MRAGAVRLGAALTAALAPVPSPVLVVGALLLLAGCSKGGPLYRPDPGPYDALAGEELALLAEASTLADAGELRAAHNLLVDLTAREPRNLPLAVRLQDVRIELLARGEPVAGLTAGGEGSGPSEDPAARVLPLYERRLEAGRAVSDLVLVARIEPDPVRAAALLDEAERADPECVWVHYARAHTLARGGDLRGALDALGEAFDLDQGHLPSRRLEAQLLSRASERGRARGVLEQWLVYAEGDPRTTSAEVARARLELARLALLDDDTEAALEHLDAIEPGRLGDPVALATMRAAALDAEGDPAAALAEIERARRVDPRDPLPAAQAALVHELRLGDREEAARLWSEVAVLARDVALGGSPIDLDAMLLWGQARVRVERYEAEGVLAPPAP
jgi:tetratricopeptide (TPR) repeat protein